jgi:uncharacterized protein YcbX
MKVGTVSEIARYPVKSFAGERLQVGRVEPYGLQGDRVGAFYDTAKTGWSRFITARQIPGLLAYQAAYRDGDIRVTAADGQTFGWDNQLLEHVQRHTSTPISMSRLYAPHPEDEKLMSVDEASLLLITDAGLKKLEAAYGKPLDPLRFRGNLIIALDDDRMNEGDWIGRMIEVGEIMLRVDSSCQRCTMITIDPQTLDKDASLLRTVHERLDLQFGVYASVIRTGQVRLGDPVNVL